MVVFFLFVYAFDEAFVLKLPKESNRSEIDATTTKKFDNSATKCFIEISRKTNAFRAIERKTKKPS